MDGWMDGYDILDVCLELPCTDAYIVDYTRAYAQPTHAYVSMYSQTSNTSHMCHS